MRVLGEIKPEDAEDAKSTSILIHSHALERRSLRLQQKATGAGAHAGAASTSKLLRNNALEPGFTGGTRSSGRNNHFY